VEASVFFKPRSENSEELSVEDLVDLDELEFEGRAVTDAPGVVLRKGDSSVWTLIAARNDSRLNRPNIPLILIPLTIIVTNCCTYCGVFLQQ
jgi:hypothetical protein